LVQTNPEPALAPDVALFLHGPNDSRPDVQVVWRADLTPKMLEASDPTPAINIVALVPPTSLEAMSVPISHVRAWLADVPLPEHAPDADVEGQPSNGAATRKGRPCIRWLGPENSEVVPPSRIRPGDTIIVPSQYGGCDDFGWRPDSKENVKDIGDYCSWLAKSRPILRLHPAVSPWMPTDQLNELLATDEDGWHIEKLGHILTRMQHWPDIPMWARKALDSFHDLDLRKSLRRFRYSQDQPYLVLKSRLRIPPPDMEPIAAQQAIVAVTDGELDTDSETSSLLARFYLGEERYSLETHCQGVEKLAREFAIKIGLPLEFVEALAWASRFHDIGKADPRFQIWLHEGDAEAALAAGCLLAKSGMDPSDRAGWRRAREQAGYPASGRHECLSVALLAEHAAWRQKCPADPELALYLIGTHHGRGRAFMPVTEDTGGLTTRVPAFSHHGFEFRRHNCLHRLEHLDSGWAERFGRMVRRYGYWGTAFLEAILQLADHERSKLEEEGKEDE
jgi:CRISPR-associated endonuclease/helicase Cas3